MTKADIVTEISNKTGVDKNDVLAIVEGFMGTVKNAMENGENVYLRGFGSFVVKKRAEKLGRKWITSDLGKFAIHTTRKRMIGVQRQLKDEGKSYRAFEILNLGKYERQHYIGIPEKNNQPGSLI
jgi:nucleoid DNA-binding protein